MLNIVIGAGLLTLPGLVVEVSGQQAIWSWILCSILAVPLLIVFIVMGHRYPNAGGIANFAKMGFGEVGYIICSLIFLGAVVFGLPAIALTGGYYLSEIIGISPNLIAILFVLLATLALQFSPEIGGRLSTMIATLILVILLTLLVIGLNSIEWETIDSKIVPITDIDIDILFTPILMIFFAFTGWEVASGLSEEFKNPKKDFKLAMILSFSTATFLYLSIAFIIQSVEINQKYEAAFISVIEGRLGIFGGLLITIIVTLIIFANLLGAIWAVSRLVFSLSREKYLPICLNVNAKGTPASSIIITAVALLIVLSADAINLIDIRDMLAIAGLNFLILYGVTGVVLFRITRSIGERLIAFLAIIISLGICFLEGSTIAYPIGLAIVGALINFMRTPNLQT